MTILNKPFHATRAHSRGVNTVQAIILHEINESAGQVDGRMQTALTHVGLAHQSYHYAVDASAIRAYVPITDAVYAIADTDTMSPWTIAAANPGVEPDLYTVNVAVLIGAAPMSNPCVPGCERTYPAQLLQNLQRLLAMIGIAASIDITDTEVVWRHGTELCDLDVEPLLEPIDPFDPGQEDWLCDRLAALPLGESETPMLVGSDCALYPYPTEHPWQINANGTGRQTQFGIASGENSVAAGGSDEEGGISNEASGDFSAAIGGISNEASGDFPPRLAAQSGLFRHQQRGIWRLFRCNRRQRQRDFWPGVRCNRRVQQRGHPHSRCDCWRAEHGKRCRRHPALRQAGDPVHPHQRGRFAVRHDLVRRRHAENRTVKENYVYIHPATTGNDDHHAAGGVEDDHRDHRAAHGLHRQPVEHHHRDQRARHAHRTAD
jgi:hypothetical protein